MTAYWEKVRHVHKIQADPENPIEEMIINTEWGSFGDTKSETIPHTFYDIRVNRQSVNPGVHVYEKMCAGLYLGEIVRLILVDFTDRRLLFNAQYSTELNKAYNFESTYMSAIERDETPDLEDTKHLLENVMNLNSTSLTDRRLVKRICELVGRRAARLIAAGMSAIISKRNALEAGLSISVEGTIYEHYSNFPDRVNTALQELYGDNVERINIGVSVFFGSATHANLTHCFMLLFRSLVMVMVLVLLWLPWLPALPTSAPFSNRYSTLHTL